MDMIREIRETRAAMIRASIKASAPQIRRDLWRLKEQQRLEAGENWR